MKLILPVLCALLFTLTTGCVSTCTEKQKSRYLEQAVQAAQEHAENGRTSEAQQFLTAALQIDPGYEAAARMKSTLTLDSRNDCMSPTLLGMNRAPRVFEDPSTLRRVLCFLPDRILDLLDVFSAEGHVGPGYYCNFHATRALQAGGGVKAVVGLGWNDQRCLGGKTEAEAGLSLLCVGATAYSGATAGTSGLNSGTMLKAGLYRPGDPIYQDYSDYWAIGFSLTAIRLGLSADFHPVEAADFFLGFFGMDIGRDDFAKTRGLQLNSFDKRLLRDLRTIERTGAQKDEPPQTPIITAR